MNIEIIPVTAFQQNCSLICTIKVHARSYANATDAKSGYNKQCTLVEAFNYCNNRTLNESRPKVADGECSEFNFFQKIQDLTLSYILIIDES